MKKKAICYFVSGHGFGHAKRSQSLIAQLQKLDLSHTDIFIITTTAKEFYTGVDTSQLKFVSIEHDIGLFQTNFFHADYDTTIQKVTQLYKEKDYIFSQLDNVLSNHTLTLCLCDISPIGIDYAKAKNVPSILMANFTWYDIYKDLSEIHPEFNTITDLVGSSFMQADTTFRLPLTTAIEPIPVKKQISCNHMALDFKPHTTTFLKDLNISPDDTRKKVLLSFGGFIFDSWPSHIFDEFKNDYIFIATQNNKDLDFENLRVLPRFVPDYRYLISECDIVFTKPGYGIIVDCIQLQKPILYTSRGRFIEYDILTEFLENEFPSAFVDQKSFLDGHWRNSLDQLQKTKKSFPKINLNGATQITEYLQSNQLI